MTDMGHEDFWGGSGVFSFLIVSVVTRVVFTLLKFIKLYTRDFFHFSPFKFSKGYLKTQEFVLSAYLYIFTYTC